MSHISRRYKAECNYNCIQHLIFSHAHLYLELISDSVPEGENITQKVLGVRVEGSKIKKTVSVCRQYYYLCRNSQGIYKNNTEG